MFKVQCSKIQLLPIEKVAAIYCALTCVLMVIMMPQLVNPVGMLVMRVEWLAMTLVVIALSHYLKGPSFQGLAAKYKVNPFNLSTFLRVLAQMAWLPQWYPDTYEFNRCLPNLDHFFAATEQSLFGCQPSLEFCQALPGTLWSEAFNLGYFSYFPMIAALTIFVFFLDRKKGNFVRFHRVSTLIMTAFFLYYVIYIFLPVAGPQFYFQAVGIDEILQVHFPALGTYFSDHTEMLPAPGDNNGLFNTLVHMSQSAGERPTAAFPSSHIGISTILLLLAYRYAPRILPYLLPFWTLLCCATVYIQAHYLIDAIAGLVSAPLMLWVSSTVARKILPRG